MRNRPTKERNREILANMEAGWSLDRLAARYLLSRSRIHEIVMDERNRRAVSLDPFYRDFRRQQQA